MTRGAAGSPAPPESTRRWLITLAVMLVTSMQVLDTSVTNVALPHMQGSFSASVDEITWVFTSFLAANAVILPATGWLVARLGRRRFFLAATATFMASSLLSGAAPSLELLVFARLLQGMGGGPLIPLAQAILIEIFPVRQRGMAMAIWGLGVMVAPIVGPTLGGWITDNYSWRWIFYLNLPAGAVALLLGSAFLDEPAGARRPAGRLDALGLALLVVGTGALQVALDRGERLDWLASGTIVTLLVLALGALAAFIVWELRVPAPLVDLRVLAYPTFTIGTGLMALVGFGLYSSFMLLTFYTEHLLGYDALTAGWVLSPGGVGSLLSLAIGGRLVGRVDPRWLVSTGLAVIAYSLHLMASLSLGADHGSIAVSRLIQGVGMGLVFVPLTTMSLSAVPPALLHTASGIFNVVRNLGASVGIALLTTLLARQTQVHQAALVERVTAWDPAALERLRLLERVHLAGGADLVTARAQALRHLYEEVQRHASMKAFVDDFTLLAVVFALMVPVVWGTRPPRRAAEGAAPVEVA